MSLQKFILLFYLFGFQREYEEFKIRVNGLVAKAQKIPEEGWIMQDGTPWPGNNTRDHPGMIQVGSSSNWLFMLIGTAYLLIVKLVRFEFIEGTEI